jgi:hypothetical protein
LPARGGHFAAHAIATGADPLARRTLALALAALGLAGCASGRDDYVQANRSLYAQLPHFPGTRLQSETSTGRRKNEDGPIVGYGTRFDLALPPPMTATAVATFYHRRLLPRWRLVETLDGPVLNFRRRGALFLSINLESGRGQVLEVAVDHAFYDR